MVRTIIIIVFICLSNLALSQESNTMKYKAYQFLDTSKIVKNRLFDMIAPQDVKSLSKTKFSIYPCSKIEFVNLAEHKSLLSDSADVWGIDRRQLNDPVIYKQQNSFEPYIEESINKYQSKKKHHPFYASFSRIQGRALPVTLYYNSLLTNENPCTADNFQAFSSAIIFFLIFDQSMKYVENVFFGELAIN